MNAAALPPTRRAAIGAAMCRRLLKVLATGSVHGHDSIVLDAWGCGAFGNDGAEIAPLFRQALEENFRGAYRQAIFAVLNRSQEKRFIGPFQRAFGSRGGIPVERKKRPAAYGIRLHAQSAMSRFVSQTRL